MPRRVSLPGAAELFRVTGDLEPAAPRPDAGTAAPADAVRGGDGSRRVRAQSAGQRRHTVDASTPAAEHDDWAAGRGSAAAGVAGRPRPVAADRAGAARGEDHGLLLAEELIDLEQARLTLRGEFGMAVDRGRIVREAIAVVLADLDAKGESSILLRRLRGI